MATDTEQVLIDSFLRGILSGKTKQAAYAEAYATSAESTINQIRTRASKLFARPEVQTRYQELRAEVERIANSKVAWDRDKSLEILRRTIENCEKQFKRTRDMRGIGSIINQSIGIINKMFGLEIAPNDPNEKTPIPVAFNFVPISKVEDASIVEEGPSEPEQSDA